MQHLVTNGGVSLTTETSDTLPLGLVCEADTFTVVNERVHIGVSVEPSFLDGNTVIGETWLTQSDSEFDRSVNEAVS